MPNGDGTGPMGLGKGCKGTGNEQGQGLRKGQGRGQGKGLGRGRRKGLCCGNQQDPSAIQTDQEPQHE